MFADLDREREILAPLGVELAIARDQSQQTLVAEAVNAVALALRGEAPDCPVNSIPATLS